MSGLRVAPKKNKNLHEILVRNVLLHPAKNYLKKLMPFLIPWVPRLGSIRCTQFVLAARSLHAELTRVEIQVLSWGNFLESKSQCMVLTLALFTNLETF